MSQTSRSLSFFVAADAIELQMLTKGTFWLSSLSLMILTTFQAFHLFLVFDKKIVVLFRYMMIIKVGSWDRYEYYSPAPSKVFLKLWSLPTCDLDLAQLIFQISHRLDYVHGAIGRFWHKISIPSWSRACGRFRAGRAWRTSIRPTPGRWGSTSKRS